MRSALTAKATVVVALFVPAACSIPWKIGTHGVTVLAPWAMPAAHTTKPMEKKRLI
jgi:hypothetical protein